MPYSTPRYNYGTSSAELSNRYNTENAAQAFGTFLGQQRYRRQAQDQDLMFRRQLPRVGAQYNRRGLYNSGLRRTGQQQYVTDYNTARQRGVEDEAGFLQQAELSNTARAAAYQAALQQLFEQYQAQRATVDPFAALQGVL